METKVALAMVVATNGVYDSKMLLSIKFSLGGLSSLTSLVNSAVRRAASALADCNSSLYSSGKYFTELSAAQSMQAARIET